MRPERLRTMKKGITRNPTAYQVFIELTRRYLECEKESQAVMSNAFAQMDETAVETAPHDELGQKLMQAQKKAAFWKERLEYIINGTQNGFDKRGTVSVVAVDAAGNIGKDGDLPWKGTDLAKVEMAHFTQTTRGKCVVMGRKTAESIGGPLKGRVNFVVSATQLDETLWPFQFNDYEQAIETAKKLMGEAYVIGGRSAYEAALEHAWIADRIIMSVFDEEFDGCDTQWPAIDASPLAQKEDGPLGYRFIPEGWGVDTYTANFGRVEDKAFHLLKLDCFAVEL